MQVTGLWSVARSSEYNIEEEEGRKDGGEDIINLRTTTRGTIMLMRPSGAHGPRKVRSRCIERIGNLQAKLQGQLQEGHGTDPVRLSGSVPTNQTVKRIMISKLTVRITAHKDVINSKVGGNIENKTNNLMNRSMKDLGSEAGLGEVSREEEPRRGSPPDEHSSAELAAPEPANRIRMTRIDHHRRRKATVMFMKTRGMHLGFVLVGDGTCRRGAPGQGGKVRLRN